MSRNRLDEELKTCKTCGHIYNLNEFEDCPVCYELHELSKDFLNTTDDDNIIRSL